MRRCWKKNKCFIVVECVENKNKKNEKEEFMNKYAIEEKVQNLNRALGNNDHAMIADAFEADILPMLDIYRQIALVVLSQNKEK